MGKSLSHCASVNGFDPSSFLDTLVRDAVGLFDLPEVNGVGWVECGGYLRDQKGVSSFANACVGVKKLCEAGFVFGLSNPISCLFGGELYDVAAIL